MVALAIVALLAVPAIKCIMNSVQRITASSTDCPAEAPEDTKQLTSECRQILAAEQSAVASTSSNYLALAGAIVSVVGLIALMVSLWQTRKALALAREEFEASRVDADAANAHTAAALAVARDSAAAATRLAITTENHGKLRIRPYICIDPGDGNVVAGRPASIGFKFINRGDTPALNVRCLTAIRLDRPGWTWPPVALEEIIPDGEMPSMILATGQQFAAHGDTETILSAVQYDKIKAGDLVVYAQQIVQYESMFGDKYETVAALEFSGADCFRISRPRIAPRGNSIT